MRMTYEPHNLNDASDSDFPAPFNNPPSGNSVALNQSPFPTANSLLQDDRSYHQFIGTNKQYHFPDTDFCTDPYTLIDGPAPYVSRQRPSGSVPHSGAVSNLYQVSTSHAQPDQNLPFVVTRNPWKDSLNLNWSNRTSPKMSIYADEGKRKRLKRDPGMTCSGLQDCTRIRLDPWVPNLGYKEQFLTEQQGRRSSHTILTDLMPSRSSPLAFFDPFASGISHRPKLSPSISPKTIPALSLKTHTPSTVSLRRRPTRPNPLRKWSPSRLRKLCHKERPDSLPEDVPFTEFDEIGDMPIEMLVRDSTSVYAQNPYFHQSGTDELDSNGADVSVEIRIGGRVSEVAPTGILRLEHENTTTFKVPFRAIVKDSDGNVVSDIKWTWKFGQTGASITPR